MFYRFYAFAFFLYLFFSCCQLDAIGLNNDLNKAFFSAVMNRDLLLMKKYLKEGADINYIDQETKLTAISYASYSGDIEVVKFLICSGANIHGDSQNPNSPIYFAILNDNIQIVTLLLDNGVDPNFTWDEGGGTLLTNAAQMGKLEVVKLLIEKGANINYCGKGKHSPLYRSVVHGRYDVMEYLLGRGAILNKNDKITLNELQWFDNPGNKKIFEILKSKNAY